MAKAASTLNQEAQAAYFTELALETQLRREQQERAEDRYLASQDANRIYDFCFPVGLPTVQETIAVLGQWHREDPEKPIKIVFNSPGGEAIAGFALYDYIKVLQADGQVVNTTAIGWAASMAGILLQAGDERVIGKNTTLMIHEISHGAVGKISEIDDEQRFAKDLWDKGVAILAERSTLSARKIKSRANRKDWWINAEEAVELGFADRIE